MFLYRGVTTEFHKKNGGQLKAKAAGPFQYTFHYGEGIHYDCGAKWDSTSTNAVIRHQLNQAGFPTAGISTSPHFERAAFYARGIKGTSDGFVYKIDDTQLKTHGIRSYIVGAFAFGPDLSVPEDDEVILVTPDGGPLPQALIIEMIPILAGENFLRHKLAQFDTEGEKYNGN